MGLKPKKQTKLQNTFNPSHLEFVQNLGVTIDADVSFHCYMNRVKNPFSIILETSQKSKASSQILTLRSWSILTRLLQQFVHWYFPGINQTSTPHPEYSCTHSVKTSPALLKVFNDLFLMVVAPLFYCF